MMQFIFRICIFITFIASSAYSKQPPPGFGSTCSIVPQNVNTDYLESKSAYGYLQNFINVGMNDQGPIDPNDSTKSTDGNAIVPKCQDGLQKLEICIYNDGNISSCDFFTFKPGDKKTISSISKNPTLVNDSSVSNITLTASMINETTLCLNMTTPYGVNQLVCKNGIVSAKAEVPPPACRSASKACIGINSSQLISNFSGQAIECVNDVMDNLFFDATRCSQNADSYLSSLNAFSTFQKTLQNSVSLLLTLYIIVYGFNIILHQDKFSLESVVTHVMKFMLVAYFAIGLGPFYFQDGKKTMHNGMIDWGLPLLREATSDFSQMVFSAAKTSNLCSFDAEKYPKGKKAYALWDTVDCKIGAYLGFKSVYNMGKILNDNHFVSAGPVIGAMGTKLQDGPDHIHPTSSTPEVGLLSTIFFMFLGGSTLPLGLMLIIFMLVAFSIVAGFISVYVVCLITLHALVYVSPIFIPLALFEYTDKYFKAWLKALVGSALQPMIIGGFAALIMTMYDSVLFGGENGCDFVIHQYNYISANNIIDPTQLYRSFEMVLPNNVDDCTKTIGYKILGYAAGEGMTSWNFLLFTVTFIKDTLHAYPDALLLMVISLIFYYFSSMVYDFASDITGGVGVKGVSVNALESVANGAEKLLMVALGKGKEAAKGKDDKKDDKKDGGKASGGGDTAPKRGGAEK